MTTMNRCGRCLGFVPLQLSECPNCTAAGIRGRGRPGWLAVLGASATAVTLAACYGAPPDNNYPPPSPGSGGAPADAGGTGGARADAAGSDAAKPDMANADMANADADSCADAGNDAGMHADSGGDASCP
jgi:hypothetical protein